MKKTLFLLGLLLSVAFLHAQNTAPYYTAADETLEGASNYSQNPNVSIMKQDANAKGVLWDNMNVNVDGGLNSCYYSGNDNWAWVADDFQADGAWIIEKIYGRGYLKAGAPTPTQIAVVIYENDASGCKPGAEIYRNTAINVSNSDEFEIILPTPFTLPEAGKYWISLAGVFDVSVATNGDIGVHQWYVRRGATQKECNFHFYDKMNLFGVGAATWIDAATITPGFSMAFRIEGDPNIPIDCQPVTNLAAEYVDCTKAELTWTAPTTGSTKYIVLRDGEEIATVERETYTDVAFEPTLEHAWDILVDCDGYSPLVRVTLPPCKEPDCARRPKNLSIQVAEFDEYCEATLKWQAPTDVLWKDNDMSSNSGYNSQRWMMSEFSRYIKADDFVVPAGETWYITEVYYGGFHNTTTTENEAPNYLGIEIYDDNGTELPNATIFEDAYLTPNTSGFQGTNTVLLPEPIALASGKYWIAIYGTYENDESDTRQYFVYSAADQIGSDIAHFDEVVGTWEIFAGELKSLIFRIQGYKSADPVLYNIYRDGIRIAENVAELEYADNTYDATKSHTWAVKSICPAGGESAPVYLAVANCKEHVDGVNENKATAFTIFPNPTTGVITISANHAINKIEVSNFLGQTVISQSNITLTEKTLDLSHLNNGVYFVRVISETGTSVQKFIKQ